MDLTAPWTSVEALDKTGILNDDSIGNVTLGGAFCLDLKTSGGLEVWAVPLAGGKFGVALWNRSPSPDVMPCKWSDIGAPGGAAFAVRDVWSSTDAGVFTDVYTPSAPIPAHGVVLLILTPHAA